MDAPRFWPKPSSSHTPCRCGRCAAHGVPVGVLTRSPTQAGGAHFIREPPALSSKAPEFVGDVALCSEAHGCVRCATKHRGNQHVEPRPRDSQRTQEDPARTSVFKKEEERQPSCSRKKHYSNKNWPSTSNDGRYEIPRHRSGEAPDALAPGDLTGPKSPRKTSSLP
jgi:hypothetical protein